MSSAQASPAGPTDDVLVVGGGVIGMAIAEALACEGVRVRVLESEGIASGASGAAAGMLAPISEAGGDETFLRLGLESLSRFAPLAARLREASGIDPELEASGLLRLVADEPGRLALAAQHARVGALAGSLGTLSGPAGASGEWLDAEALRGVEPELSAGIHGAFFSPFECHLRPPLWVRALEASARARGAAIETGVRALTLRRVGRRIVGVESSAGRREAGAVVLAAGPWTAGLLEASSIRPRHAVSLPIEPVRGQILSLAAPLPRTRSIVWSDEIYCVPKRDGSWIVGATEERVGFDRRVTAEGVAWLLDRARALFPSLRDASFDRAWAGLRPVSADGLPYVGAVPGWEGLHLAAGHGRNGVLLSPITAERIRDELLGKAGMDDLARALSPARVFGD